MKFSFGLAIASLAVLSAAAPAPAPEPAAEPNLLPGQSCSSGPYVSGIRIFQIRCNTSVYGQDLDGVTPSVQPDMKSCVDRCAKSSPCRAVHWQSGDKACYLINHAPQTVGVVGAGVPQDANVALRAF